MQCAPEKEAKMGSCLQNIKTGRGWLWSVKQLGLALIRGKRLEQNLAKFCTQCSKWAHHYTRCTTNVHQCALICTNVNQCAPTVGIINSHDDRVHSNLGQMPRSNIFEWFQRRGCQLSRFGFWTASCWDCCWNPVVRQFLTNCAPPL